MAEKRVTADWESIERDYRAGVLSIREVAKLYSLTEGAIRKKAKSQGWERDLTAKVNEKVRTELVRSSVRTGCTQTEREIVEVAAATVVQVVRSHRARITQGSALVELLTKQLIDVVGNRDEFEREIEIQCADDKSPERMARLMRAVSLDKHSTIAVNLANATKTWVGLERQAFSIPDATNEADTAPIEMTSEQRQNRIAELQARLKNARG